MAIVTNSPLNRYRHAMENAANTRRAELAKLYTAAGGAPLLPEAALREAEAKIEAQFRATFAEAGRAAEELLKDIEQEREKLRSEEADVLSVLTETQRVRLAETAPLYREDSERLVLGELAARIVRAVESGDEVAMAAWLRYAGPRVEVAQGQRQYSDALMALESALAAAREKLFRHEAEWKQWDEAEADALSLLSEASVKQYIATRYQPHASQGAE
jgi:flagellar motor protein MotB